VNVFDPVLSTKIADIDPPPLIFVPGKAILLTVTVLIGV
jgi:hypothetical protein